MKILAMLLSLSVFSVGTYADCTHKGKSYPTGTVIGPLVCTADGTWAPKTNIIVYPRVEKTTVLRATLF